MRGLFHISFSFAKLGAVTVALACAGGAMVAGQTGAAGPQVGAPTALDHYLCTGTFHHGGCVPASVTLPNGTSFAVNNPQDSLTCHEDHRGHRAPVRPTVLVTNEFSPGGTTPVPLAAGQLRATCSVLPAVQSQAVRAQDAPVPVATFSCNSVHYPWRSSVRFAPPFPVSVNTRSMTRVLDPWLLCVPEGPQPMAATATDLVCFTARVASAPRRFFAEGFGLCVPSSEGTIPPPVTPSSSTSTTSSTTTTTTTAKPPTPPSSTTTTTTKPPTPPSSTTTTTTKPPTPPSSTTTTTTSAPPSSTTSTTRPQPCAGILAPDGSCIINS